MLLDSVALSGSSLIHCVDMKLAVSRTIVGLAASVLLSTGWGIGLLHLLGEEANLSLDVMNICTVSDPLPGVSRER